MQTYFQQLFTISALVLVLSGCNSNNDKIDRFAKRSTFPESESSELLKIFQPESQQFQLSADKDTVISAKGGTKVFIPQNSFVNADGSVVKGNVKIEIIEALTVADMIKMNLQTVSDGKILQSEGMLYIDATANGEQVFLPETKSLQIELPNLSKDTQNPQSANLAPISIFNGQYDKNGKLNWVKTGEKEKKLIPLPKEYLNRFWWGEMDSESYLENKQDSVLELNGYSTVLHSFFATSEFRKRLHICYAEAFLEMLRLNQYKDYRYNGDEEKYIKIALNRKKSLLSIYLENIRNPLWFSDSIAYEVMKSKIALTQKEKPEYYQEYQWGLNSLLGISKSFYDERLTNVIILDYPGIDLSKSTARARLTQLGKSSMEIDEIFGASKRREAIIAGIKEKRRLAETQRFNEERAVAVFSNTFSANHIGWINCDRYYDNPKAKEAKLQAKISNAKDFEYVSMIMVIDSEKVALNAQILESGDYSFTGKDAPYTKLPIGKKASIIAIATKNKKLYYAIKPITIAEKADFVLTLVEGSKAEFDKKIAGIK